MFQVTMVVSWTGVYVSKAINKRVSSNDVQLHSHHVLFFSSLFFYGVNSSGMTLPNFCEKKSQR